MNSIEPELKKGIVILQSKKVPREHLEVPLLYSIRNNDEDYTGRMEDAIEGGILINIKDHLGVGTNLDIELFLPEYCGLKSIKAITQIVWTQLRGAKDGDEYEYGLKFIDMDGDNIARLKKLLDCLE